MLVVLAPNPMPPPQPQPDPPANIAAIKPYTRVELPDPGIRCVDGTRPIIYVDKAVGPPSNRWLISTTGGDSCAAGDLDGLPGFENGNECLRDYVAQQGQFIAAGEQFFGDSDTLSRLRQGLRILSVDRRAGPGNEKPPSRTVVRADSIASGRATHLVTQPNNGGPTLTYDLYSHGQKIVLEALDTLLGPAQQGLSYTNSTASPSSNTGRLDAAIQIADAEQVLLVGHSAAAHGLYQNADRIADHLRARRQFNEEQRWCTMPSSCASARTSACLRSTAEPDPADFVQPLSPEEGRAGHPPPAKFADSRHHEASDLHFADTHRSAIATGGWPTCSTVPA